MIAVHCLQQSSPQQAYWRFLGGLDGTDASVYVFVCNAIVFALRLRVLCVERVCVCVCVCVLRVCVARWLCMCYV